MDLVVLEGSLTGVLVSWDLSVSKDTLGYPTADPNNSHSEATIGFIKACKGCDPCAADLLFSC